MVKHIRVSEAARLCGKSRQTIYRYINKGKLSTIAMHDGFKGVDMSEVQHIVGSRFYPEETVLEMQVQSLEERVKALEAMALAQAMMDESERELEIIREIRALRREGYTLRAISEELAKRGVFSRNGKPFYATQN